MPVLRLAQCLRRRFPDVKVEEQVVGFQEDCCGSTERADAVSMACCMPTEGLDVRVDLEEALEGLCVLSVAGWKEVEKCPWWEGLDQAQQPVEVEAGECMRWLTMPAAMLAFGQSAAELGEPRLDMVALALRWFTSGRGVHRASSWTAGRRQ